MPSPRSQSQRKRRATVFQQELELFEEGTTPSHPNPNYAAFICEVGWTGTTMAEVNTRRKAGKGPGRGDSRTPTATTIATTSQTGRRAQEVAPEARAHIESLQKSMGSAFMPKLEQDIVAVARASPQSPKAGDHAQASTASVRCGQNSFEGSRWQMGSVQSGLAVGIQPRIRGLPQEAGGCYRRGEGEEAEAGGHSGARPDIRTSTTCRGDDAPKGAEAPELKFTEPVDLESDEELMKDAEMEHHKPTFGRVQNSPTRQADHQL